MDRRQFLQHTVAGTAVLATGSHPRAQPVLAQEPPRVTSAPLAVGEEVAERDVADLRRGLESGQLTARALTQAYLRRIDALDRQGPTLNSVIELNPDALEIAERLDIERKAGKVRGPLHGIPVLIKDNIDTADRMKTTAGSLALVDARPLADAGLVTRLREAGVVILGKTNLSEWANFRSEHSTSGWSGRGGLTRNAYALDRNACGSSSGSGTAAAASLCAVAVGTETDGSIICPSSRSGLVGIKPTVGLVSRSGIIPISATQDTAGPMARTVADAAALLQVLAGTDARDAATTAQRRARDYTEYLQADALQGKRIGVMRNFFGFDARVDALMEDAIKALEAAGAVIVDKANLPTRGQFGDAEYEVLLYEFKAGVNAYLATLGPSAPMKTLQDLIAFNEAHAKEEMPYFGQDIFLAAQKKGPLTDKAYLAAKARAARLSRAEGLDRVFALKKVDALLSPSGGPAWLTDLVNGDYGTGGSSGPAAVSGYPSITVPAGLVRGLPVGVSFTGPAWSEGALIAIAYAYEQRTKLRRPPQYLPNALV
ncbi:amidase [Luteitalea sp. TBR-22]|uniref:amidase n=1 Tax=Luteitalea sp. TBR-22 TaxID=2802971 RepID=UPI001AF712DF|nr:amidase [Luteitalea sp. TBR-22]BCS31249.1 amidase [Luteitalea sp. TBR-22]